MSNYDFIPQNVDYKEEHVEQICRCIINDMSISIYDGRNIYTKQTAVSRNKVTGAYEWALELHRDNQEILFYPSTTELKEAMDRFKEKGYHPFYDDDVCFYKVAKDRKEVQGKHAIASTIWL